MEAHLSEALPKLEGWLGDFEAFYKVANLRDQILSENILKKVITEREPVSVLIAGGFHKDRLIKKMTSLGLSVLVVAPRFGSETSYDKYFQILKSRWEARKW